MITEIRQFISKNMQASICMVIFFCKSKLNFNSVFAFLFPEFIKCRSVILFTSACRFIKYHLMSFLIVPKIAGTLSSCYPIIFSLQRSHPNEMLTGLRYFERPIKGSNGSLTKVTVEIIFA